MTQTIFARRLVLFRSVRSSRFFSLGQRQCFVTLSAFASTISGLSGFGFLSTPGILSIPANSN
jgi:hypothetical protein